MNPSSPSRISNAEKIRRLLAQDRIFTMPCCYDGLSARMVAQAGFELTFMTGFGVSAVHGYPDTQLLSYGEMLSSAASICSALEPYGTPCFGDADTGYGNAMNIKRTVKGYLQMGCGGIMIEDQVAPKRCGHTRGKSVASREEAYLRIRAAVDARAESSSDIVIIARTDARGVGPEGLDEAIARCREFIRLGADVTFIEAPRSIEEMKRICVEVPGVKMANMLENGLTPICSPSELRSMGFSIAAYPLTLLASSIHAMSRALASLASDNIRSSEAGPVLASFDQIKHVVGFDDYFEEEKRYAGDK